VSFHRYINFSLGIDVDSSGGLKGGERDKKPTQEEKARVLAKAKRKFEGTKLDGYVVTVVADDIPEHP
jgi:hypothetical protein